MNAPETSAASATRRKILALGGVGTVAGVAAYLGWDKSSAPQVASAPKPAPAAATTPAAPTAPAATPSDAGLSFSRDAFVPHLNSEFSLQPEEGKAGKCKLIEVSEETSITAPKKTYKSFSLTFEADAAFLRDGGLCQVTHPQMGRMDFFLSPFGKTAKKARLQAIFTLAA